MNNTSYLFLILGMTLVTYIPRALPAVLVEKIKISGRLQKFLQLIPYTAMAALIFPGIFSADENPVVGIVGGVAAVLIAWFGCPVMAAVLGAIAADFVLLLFL